jgi:hypothetical protein
MSPSERPIDATVPGGGFGVLDRRGPTLEDVRRVRALVGSPVPTGDLEQHGGSLAVCTGGCRWVALYFFSRLEDDPDRSRAFHRAFRSQREVLADAGIATAAVCSDSQPLDAAVIADYLAGPLLLDDRLLLANALGLPTFWHGGKRHYEHLALLTTAPHPGVIRKVFYPVPELGAVPARMISWSALNL